MNTQIPSRIYYTKPSITQKEIAYVTDAVTHGWGPHCYDYIHRFERALSAHLGIAHVIATSSCTGALHMGLAALGVGSGDEVILADINWIASTAPITYLGATPVFVDILQDTWCLDPVAVEAAITPRTKAIMAVHLYGNLSDMDALLAIGKKHGIPVIEDAAEAIGSVWHGKRAGTMGAFSTFSFHGTKTVTTGEGGAFATNDSELFERVQTLSNHGRKHGEVKQFWPERIGYKYKMSNLQAAIGLAQVERVDELVARKREILHCYRAQLPQILADSMNPESAGVTNGAWMPTVVFPKESKTTREHLQKAFAEQNIDARVFFHPLSSLPMFRSQTNTPRSYNISRRAMNLPSYHDMTTEEINRVCAVLVAQP
ncbi:MAG: DegT/DnrJ/EryC1/StrS family aminotransferase [Arenimonas sp.]